MRKYMLVLVPVLVTFFFFIGQAFPPTHKESVIPPPPIAQRSEPLASPSFVLPEIPTALPKFVHLKNKGMDYYIFPPGTTGSLELVDRDRALAISKKVFIEGFSKTNAKSIAVFFKSYGYNNVLDSGYIVSMYDFEYERIKNSIASRLVYRAPILLEYIDSNYVDEGEL